MNNPNIGKGSGSQDLLSTLWIDIEEATAELRLLHMKSSDMEFNPTAYMFPKQAGDHLMSCCPNHPESSPSFGIEMIPPYRFQCFSCDYRGNLALLYARELNKEHNYLAGLKYILKNFSTSAESRPKFDLDAVLTRNVKGKQVKGEDELLNYRMTEVSPGYKYLTSTRRFTDRAINTYELGFDKERNSITIPVRDLHGTLRFIKRRNIEQKSFLNEEAVFKKDLLYGMHLIRKHKIRRVKITESETDTIACFCGGMGAVSIMGRILFDEQVDLLVRSGVEIVDLFLDNDDKGIDAMVEAYAKLKKFVRVNAAVFPPISSVKDANELLIAGIIRRVEFRPYLEIASSLGWQ